LEKNNIFFSRGYRSQNVPKNVDLIVVGRSSLLVDPQNPEYLEAKKTAVQVLSYPELLQKYLIKENSIVVAGTYGKTTITALVSWIMQKAGLNPSYAIGGEPLDMGNGVKIDHSNYSVTEGDETPALKETDPPKFMYYKPKYLLLTATKWDHPEVYKTESEYLKAFYKLILLLPSDGLLVYNLDSVKDEVIEKAKCKKISYSFKNPLADYFINNIFSQEGKINFSLNKDSLIFQTSLLGKPNLENICGAVALTDQMGVDRNIIAKAVGAFKGIKTRLEFLGESGGRFIYWDIAQYPEKVKGSLNALRDRYRKNRIFCIYDPSSTGLKHRESLAWLRGAFDSADRVIIGKVSFLKSIRKENRVTGHDIVKIISETQPNVYYEPSDKKISERLTQDTGLKDVIVFMSSGGLGFTDLIKKTINELADL
ncbi:MAG: Mur ligase family protein, partial [Bacillota bacterium]|nr:Mur ligase family protein [Bacillota bacterium]